MDDWVSAAARERPDHPAVVADDATLTYAELDAAADADARRLAALGVHAGDRVATALAPSAAFAGILHAVPRLGAALVPVDPHLPIAARDRLLEACGSRVLVETPLTGPEAPFEKPTAIDPDVPHTLIHTSGTTAAPRPVVLSAANHRASALASARLLGVEADDRWLCVLPVSHVGGLAILLRSAIYATTAVVHERFETERVRGALEAGEVTLVSLVSTMLGRLRDAGLTAAPALRGVLLGGGPLPAELLAWSRERGLPIAPTYGMTETASQVVTVPPAEALRGERAGVPLDGVRLRIDAGGEILVRGPMVASDALAPDGWLHTGDLGSIDERGRLTVEGRLKDVIVSGGENVMPARVEEALRAHELVGDAEVAGLADPEWGERVTAWIAVSGEVTDAELLSHCAERLARHEVPKEIRRVAQLPRNAAGKLRRSELSEGFI